MNDFIDQLLGLPDPLAGAILDVLRRIDPVDFLIERQPTRSEPVLYVRDRTTHRELIRFTIRAGAPIVVFGTGSDHARRDDDIARALARTLGFEVPAGGLGIPQVGEWLVQANAPMRLAAWLTWARCALT